jgi:drug/metabolite transporter (DMT)-like permease
MLILAGVVMLTIRMHKLKFKVAIWMIISMMIVSALYRFFIKISTIRIPEINGIAINSIFIGIMLLPLLFHKKTREGIKYELKNAKWALLGESLTIISMVATYIAMKNLPATLVSAVAAAQPLSILLLETIFGCLGITICRDKNILHKLIPLSLIVAGIILMYVFKG